MNRRELIVLNVLRAISLRKIPLISTNILKMGFGATPFVADCRNLARLEFINMKQENGYYLTIELKDTIPPMFFVVCGLSTHSKQFVAELYPIKDQITDIFSIKVRGVLLSNNISNTSMNPLYILRKEMQLLNIKSLSSLYEYTNIKLDYPTVNLVMSENGLFKYSVKHTEYKCLVCGEIDIDKFRQLKSKCSSCMRKTEKDYCDITVDEHNYFKKRYTQLRNGALTRHIEFNITQDDIKDQYYKQKELCYYTDLKFNKDCSRKRLSIDRMDSSKGYIKDNIVLCCNIINMMKTDLTMEEFKYFVKAIKINKLK